MVTKKEFKCNKCGRIFKSGAKSPRCTDKACASTDLTVVTDAPPDGGTGEDKTILKTPTTITGMDMTEIEAEFYNLLTDNRVYNAKTVVQAYVTGMSDPNQMNDPEYTYETMKECRVPVLQMRPVMRAMHQLNTAKLDKMGIIEEGGENKPTKKDEGEDEELKELEEENKRFDREQRKEFLRLQMEARLQRAQKMVMGQDQNQGGAVIIREPTKFDPETGEPVSFKETAMPAHLYERQMYMNPGFGQRQPQNQGVTKEDIGKMIEDALKPKNELTEDKIGKMITDALAPITAAKEKEKEEEKREKKDQLLLDEIKSIRAEIATKDKDAADAIADKNRIEKEHLQRTLDSILAGQGRTKQEIKDMKTELEAKIKNEVGDRQRTHDEKVKDAELEKDMDHHKMVEAKKEKLYDLVLEIGETEYKETKVKNQPPADMDELAEDERYFAEGGAAGMAKKHKKQPPADVDDEEE